MSHWLILISKEVKVLYATAYNLMLSQKLVSCYEYSNLQTMNLLLHHWNSIMDFRQSFKYRLFYSYSPRITMVAGGKTKADLEMLKVSQCLNTKATFSLFAYQL